MTDHYAFWSEIAAIWHRNYRDMMDRLQDGRAPHTHVTFDKIAEFHRRYRAALANVAAFASR